MNRSINIAILVLFLGLTLIGSAGYISRSASADNNRYKQFYLLNFILKDASPVGKNVPGSNPNIRQYTINFQSNAGALTGQSQVDTSGNTTAYSITVRAEMNDDAGDNTMYVIWLRNQAQTEAIRIGENTSRTVHVQQFTNNRDLSSYTVLVTREATGSTTTNPSDALISGSQQIQTAPTQAPTQQPTAFPTGNQQPPTTAPTGQENTPTTEPTGQETTTPTSEPTQQQGNVDQHMQTVINAVQQSNISQYLNQLTDAGTQNRVSGSEGNNEEALFIKDHFEQSGLETELQSFTVQGQQTNNIIGRLYGTDRDNWYLLTAHMDSTSGSANRGGLAPGADDNGSGTATLMEVARAISAAGVPLDTSIEFIAFSGEEQGLLGSQHYVQNRDQGKNIIGVVNVDMVGNKGNPDNCVNFVYESGSGGNLFTDKIVDVNQQFSLGLTTQSSNRYNPRSDHDSFNRVGVPGVFGHECTFSSVYHSEEDTIEYLSMSQIEKTAKAVAGALVYFSHSRLGQGIATQGFQAQTLPVSGFFDNQSVLGVDSEAPILAAVYFESLNDIDYLYDQATYDIDHFIGEDIPRPIFLGLFAQQDLDAVEELGYEVAVIDQTADIERYELLFHPIEGQQEVLSEVGPTFTVAPHYYLVQLPEGQDFSHEGVFAAFFDIPINIEQARPPFRTDAITPRPIQTDAEQSSASFVMIAVLIFGLVLIAAAGVYFVSKKLRA